MSNQSSTGFCLTDSDGEDTNVDRPRLGSWAGRQAYFPAAAQHLPEQVSPESLPEIPLEFGFLDILIPSQELFDGPRCTKKCFYTCNTMSYV